MKSAFAFLSVFGRASTPTANSFVWFPLVGLVLGSLVGAVWWGSERLWPPMVAAMVTVVADLVVTGLLHFDGLADTGDGLLAPMSRERRLNAMSDPAIGAFGALSVVVVVLARFAALAGARPSVLAIAGLWCASRTSMVLITMILPYARSTGIVHAFLETSPSRTRRAASRASVVVGLGVAVAVVSIARPGRGLLALGAALTGSAMVAVLSWRRLRGYTGDVLGASGVVGETVGLLVLALR